MTSLRVSARSRRQSRRAQKGVIMVLTLISLVLLLIGVAAMMRSTDTAMILVNNLAFRRDLTNRAEIAIAQAQAALAPGTLAETDVPTSNYSATRLPLPVGYSSGIPQVLISDSAYAAAKYACLPANCAPGTDGILLRWVIDRQCATATAFTTDSCGFLTNAGDAGGSSQSKKPTGSSRSVFRISVRVTGPRNTEAYFQTTAG